ncbi:Cysteine desulfurase [Richelia intracellularis HH01]|uniref:cysteine desulfurase n=1 Tax=Richelia intracellularis HH01 TaxID=1165094 RepID=M1WYZ5_9NOST|nr:cysteine desulfurase family protein [Richelia intracellularis]CCH67152.1 Cysteine desulfurase [Richelia intracellularis HH01]HAE06558.1 cysteine desulfurase [Richelia sp.]
MQIYLDYGATTPTRPEAIVTMQTILTQQWGNPSSLHIWGERAATVIETARMQIAELINAKTPESIVFTSGGTEANNLAIMGVARKYKYPQHLIISSVEHSAVAEPINLLEKWGWQVTRLPVDNRGRVSPLDLQAALQDNTVLASVIYGQSEVGTVQPIEELTKITKSSGVLFHTDAVQAIGRLPIDVEKVQVDLLSLSSHKIYGPQGAGALYIRPGVKLVPLMAGGNQEMGFRSGTQAISVIAGFGVAAELALQEMPTETPRLIELRNRLFSQLANISNLIPTGDLIQRLPHHVSFCVQNTDGKILSGRSIVIQMNLAGIGISAGTACSSGKLSPSSVLMAMGYGEKLALGAIRLTLGHFTEQADVDWAAITLTQILERLQLMKLSLVSCHFS